VPLESLSPSGTPSLGYALRARMNPSARLSWREASRRAARRWKLLVAYEILVSTFSTLVLGPLALALSYRLIELSGEPVLGNSDLARFLLTPSGIVALIAALTLALALLLIQYAGLILLLAAALRRQTPRLGPTLVALAAASPRLIGLAAVQTVGALLVALPFLGLAALTYWLLLSGTDINFYLDERPPRFWLAVAIGVPLAIGLVVSTTWFFLRFALAVPAVVLERQSVFAALASGLRMIRGRALRLLASLAFWQLLEYLGLGLVIAGLDAMHQWLFATFESRLSLLVGATVALLATDALVLQAVSAVFAIGRALIVTRAYVQASGETAAVHFDPAPSESLSRWPLRAVLAALLIMPVASLFSAAGTAREFVDDRPVRVTAHRAGSKAAPENSIRALELAMAAGADCVEIDVQLTADGKVILMHDRDLRRMTGDARDVADVTLADIADLRLRGSHPTGNERIPMLAEFLAACDDRIRLNIELKETERSPGLALAVVDVVREQKFEDRAGSSCFRLSPLQEIREAEPRMRVGMILASAQGDITRLPVDFLSLNARLVTADLVRRAHRRSLEVHVWTVNDRNTALRLLDLGVDNLITSDPAAMREIVDWYTGLGTPERLIFRLRRWLRE